jgi:hypothetical protein
LLPLCAAKKNDDGMRQRSAVAVEEAMLLAASVEAVKPLPTLHSTDVGAVGASTADEAATNWRSL